MKLLAHSILRVAIVIILRLHHIFCKEESNEHSEEKYGGTDLREGIEGEIPILEYDIALEQERNFVSDFKYEAVHTKVILSWDDIPDISQANLEEQMGLLRCSCPLEVKLLNYKANHSRILCLFKDTNWGQDLGNETEIEIKGSTTTVAELVHGSYPIRGFVVREINSIVKGYLINGHFFGHVRISDTRSGYHLHFYIEPHANIHYYTSGGEGSDPAIMFEYVAHEDRQNSAGETSSNSNDDEDKPKRKVSEGKTVSKREAPMETGTHRRRGDSRRGKRDNEKETKKDEGGVKIKENKDDIFVTEDLEYGGTSARLFDVGGLKNHHCPVCIWVQSNFAEKFGLGGKNTGVMEVINMILTADWTLRAFDFNDDYFPDNLGMKIKTILVSDEISVKGASRKKRSYKVATGRKHPNKKKPKLLKEIHSSSNENGKSKSTHSTKKRSDSTDVHTVNPREAYESVLEQMKKNKKFSGCCAMIAFVYHNLAPTVSVSSIRGLCGEHNLVLVSGLVNSHKIGLYDVTRALVHGMSHLMGASHVTSLKFKCKIGKPSSFIDPLLMHPTHQLNVGLRPNSFRMSPCTEREVANFLLTSAIPSDCFKTDTDSFCGNGITENEEVCDCGSMMQCQKQQPCCGERDSPFQCKMIQTGRNLRVCEGPQHW